MAQDPDTAPFLPKNEQPELSVYRDVDDVEEVSLSGKSPTRRRPRYSCWEIFAFLFAGWGIVSLCLDAVRTVTHLQHGLNEDVYRPETLRPGRNLCSCGNSTNDALKLGCKYDPLSTAWLPPHCRDDELTAEFERAGPGPNGRWPYYADENGTVPLSKEQIARLGEIGGSFWSSRDWHIAHCMFYWQKYNRMRTTGLVMEARFDTLKHVKHCTKMVLAPPPEYYYLIEVPVMMSSGVEERHKSTRVSGKLERPAEFTRQREEEDEAGE